MTTASAERPLQFTLDKLFWMVALCTPTIVVSGAEWNYSFPFFTILTTYIVSLAGNYLLFGYPFSTWKEVFVGGVVLLTTGLIAFIPGTVYLGWLIMCTVELVLPMVGATSSEVPLFTIAVWAGAIVAVLAGNLLLAHHRRWMNRLASRSDFAHRESED